MRPWMGLRRPLVVIALLATASGATAQPPSVVTVEKHGTSAIVTAAPGGPRALAQTLRISLRSPGGTRSWDYLLWLDPEDTGAPGAEILSLDGRDYLFVRAYSGGAHCCWSLLVFDVRRLQALGEQLRSQTPIQLVEGRYGCTLGALALPLDLHEIGGPRATSTLYCFDGRSFARARSNAPMPFAREPPDEPAR